MRAAMILVLPLLMAGAAAAQPNPTPTAPARPGASATVPLAHPLPPLITKAPPVPIIRDHDVTVLHGPPDVAAGPLGSSPSDGPDVPVSKCKPPKTKPPCSSL